MRFNKINNKLFEILIFVFFSGISCFSQTMINDDIHSSTTWTLNNSPYEIAPEIYIRDGATLTIENGVNINFKNRYLFVGKYSSANIIADGVIFNNGTIQFLKESAGSITNSKFNSARLYLEDYSFPNIEENTFDEDSPIFVHSPDAYSNLKNNIFSKGNITISFEMNRDLNITFIENCVYHLDNDIFISEDATINIDKLTTINLNNNSIYVGEYSNGFLNADEVHFNKGWMILSDNSTVQITNSNLSRMRFELTDSAKLTILNSNLDSISTIKNGSNISVEAIDNYWGRSEGPIINDSVSVFIGDINYLPFSNMLLDPITAIEENNTIFNDYELSQNFPNPFNPTTVINYSLGLQNKSNVLIKIYDILGREIETLVNKYQEPGKYTIIFDASNLSSGLYFYMLTHGSYNVTKKMIYLK